MREYFFSGYCRQLDSARTVEVVTENGQLDEIDCRYGDCAFQCACPIAQHVDELLNNC